MDTCYIVLCKKETKKKENNKHKKVTKERGCMSKNEMKKKKTIYLMTSHTKPLKNRLDFFLNLHKKN